MRNTLIIALLLTVALFALESGGAERGSMLPGTPTQTRQQPATQSTTGTATIRPRVINTQQLTITGSATDAKAFSPVKLTTQQLTITGSNPDAKFTPKTITTQPLTITGPSSRR